MIVYIASFPRCGNSLVRDVIHQYFKYPSTNVYPLADGHNYPKNYEYATHWRQGSELGLWDKRKFWLVWNKWIALYDRTAAPETKNLRFLLRGCLPALTPTARQRLASERDIFFVKTHEHPYAHYFPGEYVIQPVRHPGAVFRSYYNLLNKGSEERISLDELIQGRKPFGSYSDYHLVWSKALEALGERGLRIQFEEMASQPRRVADCLHTLTGLNYDESAQPRTFESRQSHNPHMFGFGSNAGWESFFTVEQLRTLSALHRDVMTLFGYAEPDYTQAKHPETASNPLSPTDS